MSDTEINLQMVQEIERLKREVERLGSMLRPPFTILSTQQSLEAITANQNNYALGNYDVLYLNPTAARTINGITNGYTGRVLTITNLSSSSFALTFTHLSGSANVGNQIVTPTSGSIVINKFRSAQFIYVWSGFWVMNYPNA